MTILSRVNTNKYKHAVLVSTAAANSSAIKTEEGMTSYITKDLEASLYFTRHSAFNVNSWQVRLDGSGNVKIIKRDESWPSFDNQFNFSPYAVHKGYNNNLPNNRAYLAFKNFHIDTQRGWTALFIMGVKDSWQPRDNIQVYFIGRHEWYVKSDRPKIVVVSPNFNTKLRLSIRMNYGDHEQWGTELPFSLADLYNGGQDLKHFGLIIVCEPANLTTLTCTFRIYTKSKGLIATGQVPYPPDTDLGLRNRYNLNFIGTRGVGDHDSVTQSFGDIGVFYKPLTDKEIKKLWKGYDAPGKYNKVIDY